MDNIGNISPTLGDEFLCKQQENTLFFWLLTILVENNNARHKNLKYSMGNVSVVSSRHLKAREETNTTTTSKTRQINNVIRYAFKIGFCTNKIVDYVFLAGIGKL